MSDLIIAESTDTSISLDLTIDQEGAGGVTGLTPTVSLRDSTTMNRYLDFNDNTFKTSGWTTKDANMSEVEDGHYKYDLDVTSFSASVGSIYIVEYAVNDGGSVVGNAHDRLVVVSSYYDIPSDMWDEATSAHVSAGTFGLEVQTKLTSTQAAQLLDIYRIFGLDPTSPLIVSKTARTAGGGISQTIQENAPTAGSVTVTRA